MEYTEYSSSPVKFNIKHYHSVFLEQLFYNILVSDIHCG